jgi:hypothetical protein
LYEIDAFDEVNRTMKNFNGLSERELLALAISLEEEDERIYADFFEGLRQDFAASATVFDSMRKDESEHRFYFPVARQKCPFAFAEFLYFFVCACLEGLAPMIGSTKHLSRKELDRLF